jgi:hypothetical protein
MTTNHRLCHSPIAAGKALYGQIEPFLMSEVNGSFAPKAVNVRAD